MSSDVKGAVGTQVLRSRDGRSRGRGDRELRGWLPTLKDSRLCLADWRLMLGPSIGRVGPFLVKCVGEVAKSYPAPGTRLRLRVGIRANGYVAHPVGEFAHDAEDVALRESDVQLWRLDWQKVVAEFGETGGGAKSVVVGGNDRCQTCQECERGTPKKMMKRSRRTAVIDALKKALRAHLRGARDRAYSTQERTGTPELLPRPTQRELAGQIRVNAASVSRAINDTSDREIGILWDIANDVDQVMNFKG